MSRKIPVGARAGFVAGVVFGPSTEILPVSVLLEAQTAHVGSRLVGWVACLVYGVIIGGIFGSGWWSCPGLVEGSPLSRSYRG